ncbi:MAG: DUF5906 domain-containing protein, partial [Cyanobacteria bacterium P01_E01_bin.42]
LPKVGRMRAILCQGTGSNGKDSLREAVSQLFGGQGMSSCSLSDFRQYDQGRKFPLSPLGRNPRINWSSENTGSLSLDHVQSLKQAISGDPLTAEQKGKDGVDIDVKTVFFFNVNEAPLLSASLDAIATRYCILTFDKTFKTDPNLSYGELQADPLFKHDPHFIRDNILPALLNKILDALSRLPDEGINYAATDEALNDIRRESNHLIAFCQDVGLKIVRNAKTYIKDIWERLEQWYIDNGTLEIEETDGRKKYFWNEQVRRSDLNVKRNHVAARFQRLFPKAKKGKDSYVYLEGIAFSDAIEGNVRDRGEENASVPSLASHSEEAPPSAIVGDRERSQAIVSDRMEEQQIDSSSQEVDDRECPTSIANDRERSRMAARMPKTLKEQAGQGIPEIDKSDRECSSLPKDAKNFSEEKVDNRVEEMIVSLVDDLRVCESLDAYDELFNNSMALQKVLRGDGILPPNLLEEASARLSPEEQARIDNLLHPPKSWPAPVGLKKGDRVVAPENSDWGVGIVQKVYEIPSCGLQVHVKWKAIKEDFPVSIVELAREGEWVAPAKSEEDEREEAIAALVEQLNDCPSITHFDKLARETDSELLAAAIDRCYPIPKLKIGKWLRQEEERKQQLERELNHVNPFASGDRVALLGSPSLGLGEVCYTYRNQCRVIFGQYESPYYDHTLLKVGQKVCYVGDEEKLKKTFANPKAGKNYRSLYLTVKALKEEAGSVRVELTHDNWLAWSFWVDLGEVKK